MADYWAIEPPMGVMYKAAHFRSEDSSDGSGVSPDMEFTDYYKLQPHMKDAVKKTWLKRNVGKTESDFFVALRKRVMEKYGKQLDEVRKKKLNA